MWIHRHKWLDQGSEWSSVYLLFVRPMGKAKLQYCQECGIIRFVGINQKDDWDKIIGAKKK
jgi:hypothetical protein